MKVHYDSMLTIVCDHDIIYSMPSKWEGSRPMEPETIMISTFKATCLSVLERVKKTGQPILVTRRGEAIALIEPPPQQKRDTSWMGTFASRGRIAGDIISPALDSKKWEVLQ
jgi:prevent-host-death family protein